MLMIAGGILIAFAVMGALRHIGAVAFVILLLLALGHCSGS